MKMGYYKVMKTLSNILFAFFALVLVLVLYSFISLNVLSHKYVNFFSYSIFQIGSNSMAPSITTNDLIIIKITNKIKQNDIVTYEEGKSLITHRVIMVRDDGYVTRGDANNENDKVVNKKQIIGKVIKVLPNFGVWFKVITTPKIIALICLTLFSFSVAFSYSGKKYLSKNDDFGIYYSGIKMKDDKHDQ